MRITTQMLAHSAAKSGIPFQQTTLLDILNKKVIFFRSAERSECQCGCNGDRKRKKNYSKAGRYFGEPERICF